MDIAQQWTEDGNVVLNVCSAIHSCAALFR